MDYIKGITFMPFAHRGYFEKEEVRKSLLVMQERTGADTVILAPAGVQKTPQSTEISWMTENTVTDTELCSLIEYAKNTGLRVILKPTVNCLNGVWRAFINFFDEDVPCEPKWSDWFRSHTEFQLHYAQIAEDTQCDMFITGCEMVMSERREVEWRELIRRVKSVYHGPVSYNTDKYQEHNVKWWDCVDVISSSGYYPADDWERQLDRIEKVVMKYQKPFFFAEMGCMSTTGSKAVPNDWGLKGAADPEEQKEWYEKAFAAMDGREWVQGAALWSWPGKLYTEQEAGENRYYEFYLKPAEKIIRRYFSKQEK
ncbi:MAG: 1,4-beta-xylanase [Lachnospiraceae bacterium]|nr:1,4-beta-xylanase [Lachnospiraceae bacterium]